jgi:hypothetical protein
MRRQARIDELETELTFTREALKQTKKELAHMSLELLAATDLGERSEEADRLTKLLRAESAALAEARTTAQLVTQQLATAQSDARASGALLRKELCDARERANYLEIEAEHAKLQRCQREQAERHARALRQLEDETQQRTGEADLAARAAKAEADKEEESRQLTAKLNVAVTERQQREHDLAAEQAESSKLREELAAVRREAERASRSGQADSARLCALQEQVDAITAEKVALEGEVGRASRALREGQSKAVMLEQEALELRQMLAQRDAHSEQLEADVRRLRAQVEDVKKEPDLERTELQAAVRAEQELSWQLEGARAAAAPMDRRLLLAANQAVGPESEPLNASCRHGASESESAGRDLSICELERSIIRPLSEGSLPSSQSSSLEDLKGSEGAWIVSR